MWYDVVAAIDPARHTAHLLDFRGAGLSDRPMAGHDLEGYASDLRCAIAAIDAPLTIVAHSMGGKVAQYVALSPPAELRRLILVAPGSARGAPGTARHRDLALAAFGSRLNIERFQRGAMLHTPPPPVVERLVEDALLAQREAWFGWYDRGRPADFAHLLDTIRLPVTVVAGERDPIAPSSRLRRDVQARIAGALFVELRGVAHNLPVEAPAELAGIIDRLTAV